VNHPPRLERHLRYLLREKYGFEGLVASDVLEARGPLSPEDEADVAMRALDAGCDVLLGPSHLDSLVDTLERCVRDGPLYEDRIEQSRRRRLKWAQWAAPQTDYRRVSGSDVAWALQLAERVVTPIRGAVTRPELGAEIVIVDDDEPCVPAHPRTAFAQTLESSQLAIDRSQARRAATSCVRRGFGGKPSAPQRVAYRRVTRGDLRGVPRRCARRQAVIVLLRPTCAGPPGFWARAIVCAWSGDPVHGGGRWLLR
jgi:beta-glucosidase-like glycosyl hydrolase